MIVTPLYAGILALLYFALSYRVVQMRGHGQPSLGDGGDVALLRRIRGHANFAEYVPFILLMIGLLELGHFPVYLLHALGASLVVARLLHGYALSYTDAFKFGRYWGTALTFTLLVVCGALCVYCKGLELPPGTSADQGTAVERLRFNAHDAIIHQQTIPTHAR